MNLGSSRRGRNVSRVIVVEKSRSDFGSKSFSETPLAPDSIVGRSLDAERLRTDSLKLAQEFHFPVKTFENVTRSDLQLKSTKD